MSKQQELKGRAKRNGIILVVALVVFGGIYFAADSFDSASQAAKSEAENGLNNDSTKLAGYTSQIERSGDAEKRFIALQQQRENLVFEADIEQFSSWLATIKDQYRFARGLKVTVANEKPSDKSELQTFDYSITLRPAMEISLEAISDMHVFSFLEDLQRQSVGIVNITHIEMKRKSEMDLGAITEMRAGTAPYLVEAKITFDWIGVGRKQPKAGDKPAAATPGAPVTPATAGAQ